MIRAFDLTISFFGLLVAVIPLLLLAMIGIFDSGSPLFLQHRLGLKQKKFMLIKLRTMKLGTASTATHLVDSSAITPFGRFLRRTKLDELPQLWNVLKGDMSLVGPRPCLPSQIALINARNSLNVFESRPGITGLAQLQGVDMSNPEKLAKIDSEMIKNFTIRLYFYCILKTVLGGGQGDKVRDIENH